MYWVFAHAIPMLDDETFQVFVQFFNSFETLIISLYTENESGDIFLHKSIYGYFVQHNYH